MPNWLTNSPEELNFCKRRWAVSATQALPEASIAVSRGAERRRAPEDSPPNLTANSHPRGRACEPEHEQKEKPDNDQPERDVRAPPH